MSHNYIACRLCRWMIRARGRRTDPDRAFARLAHHIEESHPHQAEPIGAAAVSVASQEEQSMPHRHDHVHHTGVFTAHGGHHHIDHPHHINNIFGRAVQEAKDAGYHFVHAGMTTDGVHHRHEHADKSNPAPAESGGHEASN